MESMDEFTQKLKSIANQSNLRESAAVFERSRSFIDSNREELLKRCPDCWVAVYKEQVLATDKELQNLINTIRKSGKRLEHIAVELLTSERNPIHL